jgi:alginate O-acetyltransferase complex protein AlgI
MWFNTYTFGAFLAIVFSTYWVLPPRGRQFFLLAASYVFYCWKTPIYGLLLVISTLLDYSCGLGLEKTERPRARRLILLASLVGNLGLLGFFKYADFFGGNLAGIGQWLGFDAHWRAFDFILPAGISFYTFQTLSYTLQVYRRQIKTCHDPVAFALYVAYFPQLVAGPIEHAGHLLPQLQKTQAFSWDNVSAGAGRILLGLFRKMVVADRLAIFVDRVFAHPAEYSTASWWIALGAFAMQVYFDFAGYSDIAIGSARLFGVRLTENFRRPLMARSVADFWDRWHLTLTAWLRENVFYPLGGSRRGPGRTIFNIWVLFLLCGLWHGASWNFVLWGAYFAFFNMLVFLWRRAHPLPAAAPRDPSGPGRLLGIASTYLMVALAASLFRAKNLAGTGVVWRALAGRHPGAVLATEWDAWFMAVLMLAIFVVEYRQEYHGLDAWVRNRPPWQRALAWFLLILVLIFLSVSNQKPYVYFQF